MGQLMSLTYPDDEQDEVWRRFFNLLGVSRE